ncbi:GntR family transcriptional regulator [Glutamicibacter sp. PAEs-4]|uniref:GntR family transcriptional regulator n=1 Tax=Glutamicibacter sp. PAEs-4 TaxID=3444114 RepID=UPI003EB91A16
MHGAVHAQLKDDLLQGAFQPGDALREVALAERFGVSRTPVREALTRLLHEGQAAQEAASVRTEVDLMRLQALVDLDRALAEPDDATRLATNIEFHRALWRAAHNPVLEDLLERLATHQIHAPSSTLSVGSRWTESLDEHQRIVDHVRERDSAKASELIQKHMSTAKALRLKMFASLMH